MEARQLAAATGDQRMATVLSANIASLYLTQGAFPEAEQAIQDAFKAIPDKSSSEIAGLFLLLAELRARQQDLKSAIPLYREALDLAERHGDDATFIDTLDSYGNALLKAGSVDLAEDVLAQSLRRRLIVHEPAPSLFYQTLSRLRLAQNDIAAARMFADKAFSAARQGEGKVPIYSLYQHRARVLLAQGDDQAAYRDLEQALRYVSDLRLAFLPADAIRVSAGMEDAQEIRELFIDVAGRLYSQTRREGLARKAFEAAEHYRALGLRESLQDSGNIRRQLSPEYWETLKRLTDTENQLFRADDAELRRTADRLRHQLTEFEIAAGLKNAGNRANYLHASSKEIQRALRPSETLFSFILGKENSYVWALTATRFELYQLDSREQFERTIKQYRESVQAADFDKHSEIGRRMYALMFGPVASRFLQNPDWLLLLDGALFELPFAALEVHDGHGKPEYLAQAHSLRVIPSSAMLLEPGRKQWTGPLLAVGDPVYNAADPRWVAPARPWTQALLNPWRNSETVGGPQFARLPGSAQETRACAKVYAGRSQPAILLSGNRANVKDFEASFAQMPSAIHLATHVVPSPRNARVGTVAFSLMATGGPELLGTDAVSSFQLNSGLVVMSGCNSGSGELLPAEGLWGLTRAWLRAGTHNVMATLWPTLDNSGDLLRSFYRHLGAASDRGFSVPPEKALQLAQIEMLQSGTWKAEPRHWAGYVIFSKQ